MYATMHGPYGWTIIHVTGGTAVPIASFGVDQTLADQCRDWLTHRERIGQLLERHGHVDVPLDQVEEPAP